ncbi:MAG: NCS2 family permease [Acidobacteria bacterium]|nr:NCS2 family permease [Acidobacteriota bacterium]
MAGLLERYFELRELGTDVRTELLAGLTTFLTMSYIVFVNPSILADAGLPAAGVTAATCLAAAAGSLGMGLWARRPIALAPGMGINAYFTYGVVLGMGVPWQTALGAVFVSGAVFLLLTGVGVRQRLLEAIPPQLYQATAAGIGLFLALIGLRNAGLIQASEATLVTLGDLGAPATLLSIGGLLAIAAMLAWGVRAAMLLGILGATAAAVGAGVAHWQPGSFDFTALGETVFALDIADALELGLLEIIFVFLFVDFFDSVGTILAVATRAGMVDEDGKIPRIGRMLTVDASATMVGALAGTSTTTCYIESAAGVAVGGRSGLTAVVVGLLFLLALPLAPLIGLIPAAATAPALILVGSMMAASLREIDWDDVSVSVPAFLILLTIPLTYSIANGLAIGFLAHDALQILTGRGGRVPWMTHGLAALFLARFIWLATG